MTDDKTMTRVARHALELAPLVLRKPRQRKPAAPKPRVASSLAVTDWSNLALTMIAASLVGELTGADLRVTLGRLGLDPPAHPRLWGMLVKLAVAKGLLEKTENARKEGGHSRPVYRRVTERKVEP